MAQVDGRLTEVEVQNFLTIYGERLILAARQHWFVLAGPIFITIFFGFIFTTASFLLFIIFTPDASLFFSILLVTFITTISFLTKVIVDWYYHLYIVTTRRIIEVSCSPFFSDTIYDVLLDQVRITEVDVKVESILHEFLDMGHVVVIFDRPSHEEKFIFHDIPKPRQTGTFLCDIFESIMHEMPVWFQPRRTPPFDAVRITDDIPDHPGILRA